MPGQRKLGMPTDQRRALLRNQVTSFLENGKMTTTVTRAKETRSMAEKMITLGKKKRAHLQHAVRHWHSSQRRTL